jgi:hypothetical protein
VEDVMQWIQKTTNESKVIRQRIIGPINILTNKKRDENNFSKSERIHQKISG